MIPARPAAPAVGQNAQRQPQQRPAQNGRADQEALLSRGQRQVGNDVVGQHADRPQTMKLTSKYRKAAISVGRWPARRKCFAYSSMGYPRGAEIPVTKHQ